MAWATLAACAGESFPAPKEGIAKNVKTKSAIEDDFIKPPSLRKAKLGRGIVSNLFAQMELVYVVVRKPKRPVEPSRNA